MKNLISNSYLILCCLLSSLVTAQPSNGPPFTLPAVEGLYGINMHIKNMDFSGLLLLKRLNDSSFRLVMTSELGPKMLDLDLAPEGYKINYAYPKLKKRRVLNTFYEDFSTLCCLKIWMKHPRLISGTEEYECQYNMGKRVMLIYSFEPVSGLCNRGRIEKKMKIITSFYYFRASDSTGIDRMRLEHNNFGMVITLNKIE
jgi:hypothetical protein